MTDDPLVQVSHIRAVGYRERGDGKTFCASGIREWCRTHDLDYMELVHTGIAASIMESKDGWGVLIAQEARNDHGRE